MCSGHWKCARISPNYIILHLLHRGRQFPIPPPLGGSQALAHPKWDSIFDFPFPKLRIFFIHVCAVSFPLDRISIFQVNSTRGILNYIQRYSSASRRLAKAKIRLMQFQKIATAFANQWLLQSKWGTKENLWEFWTRPLNFADEKNTQIWEVKQVWSFTQS